MLEVWHLFNKFLKESITKAETEEEVYKAEIYELDQKGGHLISKFSKLVGLEAGDPEAVVIEQQILNPEPRRRLRGDRRVRRNYRTGFEYEEYIPPHYLPEYEYAEEIESSFEPMYMDYIAETPKEDSEEYEEEPDEDEAHIRQVHNIIFERQKIREKMEILGVDQIEKVREIEQMNKLRIALLAAKAPIENSQDLIENQLDESSKSSGEIEGSQCQLHSWDQHIHELINTFNTALDKTKEIVDSRELDEIQSDLVNITYFHENWKREYSAYEEYEEESDELYE